MPGEALASGLGHDIVRAVVDGQVEGVGTFTVVGVVVLVDIRARGGVRRAVPGEVFASRFGLNIVCAVVDG